MTVTPISMLLLAWRAAVAAAAGCKFRIAQLPNILYHNNGDGTFTDVTTQSGTTNVSGALGVAWEDYDNDGYLDFYIVNSAGLLKPNKLFRNNGNGTFTDVASQAGVGAKLPGNGRGSDATFADYDNDGFLDLIV